MPLQKSPPGTQTPDAQSTKRNQFQERRRTLQTISELSVADGAPDLNPFIRKEHTPRVSFASGPITKKKTTNTSKRPSLPQYCSSPHRLEVEASGLRHTQSSQNSHAIDSRRCDEGWNARRERARAQREQADAATRYQLPASGYRNWIDDQTLRQSTMTRPSSQDYLKSYASHHQLLRNSRSISGFPLSTSQRSSLGGSIGHSSQRDYDTESFERASTDSSSYHSVHDSAVRRSRSGSSTQSFNLQAATQLPNAFAPPAERYHSNPAHFYNGILPGQFSTSMTRRPVPAPRSWSLPTIRVQDANGTYHDGRQTMSQSSRTSTQQPKQYIDIQTARLETLAALTAPRHDSPMTSRASPPTQLPHTAPSSPPSHNSYAQKRSRSRSHLSLQVPPPTYQTSNPNNNITHAPNPDKTVPLLLPPPTNSFEQRIVPKRESLTQWKAEREGAKAKFDGMRRADTKERVRRANELEEEKEKELLMMGKGTVMVEKEKVNEKNEGRGRSCFRGLFALFPWGKG